MRQGCWPGLTMRARKYLIAVRIWGIMFKRGQPAVEGGNGGRLDIVTRAPRDGKTKRYWQNIVGRTSRRPSTRPAQSVMCFLCSALAEISIALNYSLSWLTIRVRLEAGR